MSERTRDVPTLGIIGTYFFLLMMVAWPVADFLTTVLPAQWGRVEWRYASVSLMGAYLITPILGVFLAMVIALVLRHSRLLRVLSVLCVIGGVFLALAMLSLSMDVLQLWKVATPDGLPSFRKGGLVAVAKHLSALVALILIGLGGWKASRRVPLQKLGEPAAGRGGALVLKSGRIREGKPQKPESERSPDEPQKGSVRRIAPETASREE